MARRIQLVVGHDQVAAGGQFALQRRMRFLQFRSWMTRVEENRCAVVAHAAKERNKFAKKRPELIFELRRADGKRLEVVVVAERDICSARNQTPVGFVRHRQDGASKTKQVRVEFGARKALS